MLVIPTVKKLVIGAVAVGALSLGTAGLAAAAPVPGATAISHFNCARATKVLTRIQKDEARIAAKLPGLTAREARAEKAGRTKRAAHLKKLITRFESPKVSARLHKASAEIEAKCHVSAPTVPSGSTSTSSTRIAAVSPNQG